MAAFVLVFFSSKYVFKKLTGCKILFEASVILHCFALQKLMKITFVTSSTIVHLQALPYVF